MREDAPPPDPTALFPKHRTPRFRDDLPLADLAASFEEAIIDVLATKTARAAVATGARSVLLAGGVAANRRLRQRLEDTVAREWERADSRTSVPAVRWPDLAFCTDNGAMVAGLGYRLLRGGNVAGLDVDAYPRFPIEERDSSPSERPRSGIVTASR